MLAPRRSTVTFCDECRRGIRSRLSCCAPIYMKCGAMLLVLTYLVHTVKQIGHAMLTVKLPGGEEEKYLITLPRLVIAGLLLGSPYIELSETSWIASSTGYLATVCRSCRFFFFAQITHKYYVRYLLFRGMQTLIAMCDRLCLFFCAF